MASDAASTLLPGPWTHRLVSANGARFHVALAGPDDDRDAPLVVLLHGFPQIWWAWRSQIAALADAGLQVAAMDLRGFGASDKTPRGYDTATLCADVAGVIGSLGRSSAVVVGHGWGGWVAWSMPTMQPGAVSAVGSVSMPHPLQARRAVASTPSTMRLLARAQVPFAPERAIARGSSSAT